MRIHFEEDSLQSFENEIIRLLVFFKLHLAGTLCVIHCSGWNSKHHAFCLSLLFQGVPLQRGSRPCELELLAVGREFASRFAWSLSRWQILSFMLLRCWKNFLGLPWPISVKGTEVFRIKTLGRVIWPTCLTSFWSRSQTSFRFKNSITCLVAKISNKINTVLLVIHVRFVWL